MPVYFYVLILAEVSALLVGSYSLNKIKPQFLYLYLYVVLGVITEIGNIVMVKIGTQSNLWVSHIYFPLEFVLLAIFYIPHLSSILKRNWIILIITAFILYSIVNVVFIQSLKEFSHVRVYSSIILVVFSFIYFYKAMNEAKIPKLSKEPMIWVNASVLIFYSTIFFYNILANLVIELSRKTAVFIASINGYVIALFYVLVAVAFFMESRRQVTGKQVSVK